MLLTEKISGVQIIDVFRGAPAELEKTRHLRPERITDDQRIIVDRKRRRGAELTSPTSDGFHVLQIAVQDGGDQTQHDRQAAIFDFVLEVEDNDAAEMFPRARHSAEILLGCD